jgi:hypothetical protein
MLAETAAPACKSHREISISQAEEKLAFEVVKDRDSHILPNTSSGPSLKVNHVPVHVSCVLFKSSLRIKYPGIFFEHGLVVMNYSAVHIYPIILGNEGIADLYVS